MAEKFGSLKKLLKKDNQYGYPETSDKSNEDIMKKNLQNQMFNNEIPQQEDNEEVNVNDEPKTYDTRKLIDEGKLKKEDANKLYQKLKTSKSTST